MAGSVYEGKTFDEAVRKGLEALRLSRAEAVIITIEEGKGGFLGLGARPFRVSVARRPGGAIKEPSEREDRRGSRRGGREEKSGRGGREAQPHGRGAREERSPRASREERGGRGSREERPARASREERAARAPREERGGREEHAAREDRGGREERAPREPRAPREERGGRERAPREERRPQPAPAASSTVPPSVREGGDDDSPRKRRRRGRRGGRGRRRGAPEEAGGGMEAPAPVGMNGNDAFEREPRESPASHAAATAAAPAPAPYVPPTPEPVASHPVAPSPAAVPMESPMPSYEAPPASPRREDAAGSESTRREGRRERFRGRPERGGEARERSEAPDMNADELVATSTKLTEDLLRAMGFEPRVSARAEGNRVDVTVEVDRDEQLLVGRQGETRQSLQHLLNRFLNKGDGSRYHLQLEVNDSWQQREGELEELARRLAEDAVTQNAEVVSDYMNSQERRIVHVTLREDARVRTFSLGTGMLKRVAVAPASFPDRSEDDSAS